MPTAIEFIADRLPRVTVEDVRRFADTVEIRDAPAFAAELQAFIHERVEAVKLPANLEGETVEQALARKAALEGLGGRSPVDAVTHGTIDDVAEAVFNVLGVQVH